VRILFTKLFKLKKSIIYQPSEMKDWLLSLLLCVPIFAILIANPITLLLFGMQFDSPYITQWEIIKMVTIVTTTLLTISYLFSYSIIKLYRKLGFANTYIALSIIIPISGYIIAFALDWHNSLT
jgi:hypothetical protein